MRHMYPIKVDPVYTYAIWGGDRLAEIRNNPISHGSSWDISAHPHADSAVNNGEYKGKTLIQMLDEYPKEILGEKKREQMLRISIIDAAQSLSIQVHPNNEYAHKYEHDEGKSEAWYILEAKPGAKLIAGTTAKNLDEVKRAVDEDRIEEYVKRHEMEAGDFIFIDSGQLHAMGAGLIALEVSTNSDVTYRFYDFHRKDADGNERELHLKQSYDVVDCSKQCEKTSHPLSDKKINERVNILDKDEFVMEILDVDGEYTLKQDGKRFYCLCNVDGDAEIIYEGEKMPFEYTENIFIPAACGDVTIKGTARIIISYVK